MTEGKAWTGHELDAFDEEQRITDQREEKHKSSYMKDGDICSNRSSYGSGDSDDDNGGVTLADTLAYGKWTREQADESDAAVERQKIIDAIVDAVDEFIESNSRENQEIFHSVYGEMAPKKDVAEALHRYPSSISRTLGRIQGNLHTYLLKNYPKLLDEYLSGLHHYDG